MKRTRAFISYSWDDSNHKKWVAELATRLRSDKIETILDQWHTAPGDQLPVFMEREIRENQYVLILCTPNYKLRSDGRHGGVGYEGDIMTAEVLSDQNQRKFIPILVRGTWEEAAPTWLKGKYYIDLSRTDIYEENYKDLTTTLQGERKTAPTMSKRPRVNQESGHTITGSSEPIRITGVIVDQVSEPKLDGTRGSALYKVPFQLNRTPTFIWSRVFVDMWDMPPECTSMHRPRIARVVGSTIVLDGTTIDEVKKYHRKTLVLCVNKANEIVKSVEERELRRKKKHRQEIESHKRNVKDVADEIEFD